MSNISPQEWKEIFALLDTALELPPAERDTWLEALDASRDGLKPTLRELLAKHASKETDDFLRSLPRYTRVGGDDIVSQGRELKAGDHVGPYRLVRELGSGGMGSVWLAERADGAFKRSIALKLPHVTWSGGLAERLARERDILASLEHPNIARLYDAGVDELGRPFMAMEYIEGQPIDGYCSHRACTLRDRIGLVLQVASAVAHAHARLVVHRDLKPGNILVSQDGAVHLLDFGIAKLLQGDTAQETRLTQWAGRALTLDYASPEQIRGEPISTATDVYSLAVVTYELLADARPYRLKRQSAAELERAIAELDPLPASEAALDPERKRQLRGDLDAILNKAMKKDVRERYATVDAFAQDLGRHLRGEPVQARPDSAAYRFGKFVVRNKGAATAGAAVLIAIVAGAGVALWQAREAATQARLAQEQAARARQQANRAENVKRFVLSIFENADFDAGTNTTTTAADLLKRAQERIGRELTDDPAVAVELLTSVGYSLIGLDESDEAVKVLTRAVDLADRSLGKASRLATAARVTLGEGLIDTSQLDQADTTLASARDTARRIGARRELADALRWSSDLRVKQGREIESLAPAEEAASIADTLTAREDDQVRMEIYLNLSSARRQAAHGDPVAPAKKAHDIATARYGDRPSLTAAIAHSQYAASLGDIGQLEAAATELQRSVVRVKNVTGGTHRLEALQLSQLAAVQTAAGDPLGAVVTTRRALAVYQARPSGAIARDEAVTHLQMATHLLAARKEEEAEVAARTAVKQLLAALGPTAGITQRGQTIWAFTLARTGHFAEAERELTRKHVFGPDSPDAAGVAARLGGLRSLQGRCAEAAPLFARAIEIYRALPQLSTTRLALARTLVLSAECSLELNSPDVTLASLEQALAIYHPLQPHDSPDVADAFVVQGRALLALSRPAEATEALQRATAFWARYDPLNRYAKTAQMWQARAQGAAAKGLRH